ncbi:potassium channel family protein [Lysinibacillus sp. SGAir0095]|uniref:potassium channel family protein n=1 Tax=Lysinibacillus sp. SGAir0095 TaxID=2070463 RepID=UPI0010CD462F|nr:potassium channel family protein [Lysinibacillus sp. SGAir0095]QCR32382.1 Ion channel protein [Lysinibacillus sp. SGAir0095]
MLSVILSFKRLLKGLYHGVKEPQFISILTTVALIVLSGTLFYTRFEGWAKIDAFYFAVVSLIPTGVDTDLVPSTTGTKLFTVLYLIIGTGLMFALLVNLGRAIIKEDKPKKYKLRTDVNNIETVPPKTLKVKDSEKK